MEQVVQELLAGIVATDPARREEAADQVTDVHRGLDADDVELLAQALVDARLAEQQPHCQESQLNALCDLKAWHAVPASILAPLAAIRSATDLGTQKEYLEELLSEL